MKKAEILERLRNILARRQERKDQMRDDYLENILDDLEVISLVVTSLDRTFIELVRGFQIIQNEDGIRKHIDKTNDYLTERELLPKLEQVIGTVKTACEDSHIQKNYEELYSALNSLFQKVQEYRENLQRGAITGVGMKHELNLMSLIERAMEFDYSPKMDLADMARQVHYNQDFQLSTDIHELIGEVRFHVRTAKLK